MTTETSTEATQGDVQQETTPTVYDAQQTERDRIAAQHEARVIAEQQEQPAHEEQQEQPNDTATEQHENEPEQPSVQMVKVKIDGVEQEIPIDELTRNYQKSSAADKRLQQAAEERRNIAEERAELESLRKQAQPQEPERLTQLVQIRKEALKAGNVDLFEQADAEIAKERLQQVNSHAIDPEAITQRIYTELNTKIEYDNALNKFLIENKAVANNKMLYNLAMQQLNAVCNDETIETYDQAFNEVARQLQEITNAITPKPDIQTDRQALKSTIPTSAGRANARTAPPATVKEETTSDVIAQMRQARGQA